MWQSTGAGEIERGEHWLMAISSLTVGAGFFALWFWLLPSWLSG